MIIMKCDESSKRALYKSGDSQEWFSKEFTLFLGLKGQRICQVKKWEKSFQADG